MLVANASEGEPLSVKDATLLARAPHLVLEGIVLAARSVGAREAYLCLHAGSPALPAVRDALRRHDLAGVTVRLAAVPDRYVASEESALVQLLSGGPALPTSRPPRPAERGVRGAPTLVLNAETLANVALAVHCGPELVPVGRRPGRAGHAAGHRGRRGAGAGGGRAADRYAGRGRAGRAPGVAAGGSARSSPAGTAAPGCRRGGPGTRR